MTLQFQSAATKHVTETMARYRHTWPGVPLQNSSEWSRGLLGEYLSRGMPESPEQLANDSSWPAFFPSAICFISASDGPRVALEREVGASIVNRFPYVVAVSVCRQQLSSRHHPRSHFMDVIEAGGAAALQFVAPGEHLDRLLEAISSVPEETSGERLRRSGAATRRAFTNMAPVIEAAYLVYEASLVKPQVDFDGNPIFEEPWIDVGSHRVYFLEINAIALRQDIAEGRTQIRWRSLPAWEPQRGDATVDRSAAIEKEGYQKGYTPRYAFPSSGTAAFEYDEVKDGIAVKYLPPLPEDQVEVDNDRARWPCFFPSSAGLITTWEEDGAPNLMPCGSTTIVSRHPLVVAPCVSYAKINARYAPRHSLDAIRRTGRFGCGVPFIGSQVLDALRYSGNISFREDPLKVRNSGLRIRPSEFGPIVSAVPIHFDCEVVGEVRLGTHIMFLGEVKRILVRSDLAPSNPVEWYPWAALVPNGQEAPV